MSRSSIRALFGFALVLIPLALTGCDSSPSIPAGATTTGPVANHPTEANPKGPGPGAPAK